MIKVIMYLLLIINITSYSFSLKELNSDIMLKKGDKKIKEYVINNISSKPKVYFLNIDSEYNNIELETNRFVLPPSKEKTFKIKIVGKGIEGENSYFLNITEKHTGVVEEKKNNILINKNVRIKQKYFLIFYEFYNKK